MFLCSVTENDRMDRSHYNQVHIGQEGHEAFPSLMDPPALGV